MSKRSKVRSDGGAFPRHDPEEAPEVVHIIVANLPVLRPCTELTRSCGVTWTCHHGRSLQKGHSPQWESGAHSPEAREAEAGTLNTISSVRTCGLLLYQTLTEPCHWSQGPRCPRSFRCPANRRFNKFDPLPSLCPLVPAGVAGLLDPRGHHCCAGCWRQGCRGNVGSAAQQVCREAVGSGEHNVFVRHGFDETQPSGQSKVGGGGRRPHSVEWVPVGHGHWCPHCTGMAEFVARRPPTTELPSSARRKTNHVSGAHW